MLLDSRRTFLKLGDFGIIKKTDETKTFMHGTLWYAAPELYLNSEYNEKVDVYALAISIWEMFHRELVFRRYKNEKRKAFQKHSIEI